jgi:hypothetical protein
VAPGPATSAIFDAIGQLFFTRKKAIAHASNLARKLAQEDNLDGFFVSITDEQDKVLTTIPLSWSDLRLSADRRQ